MTFSRFTREPGNKMGSRTVTLDNFLPIAFLSSDIVLSTLRRPTFLAIRFTSLEERVDLYKVS